MACARVNTTQNAEILGMEQIAACINSRNEFKNQLSVSLGDTAYNNPLCLNIAKNNVNQVHVSRSMIGTPAQPPKPRKNAPGRQFGDTQVKRTRYPVVKKQKNTAATEKMIA